MKLSVVIPACNEEKNIKGTIEELISVFGSISDIEEFQIIVVDDHSSDNTFDIISKINDLRISCLRLSRRCGSHTALRAGIKEATGEAVLCISADGQEDPSCLKDMLKKYSSGVNVVWALRKTRGKEPWHIRKPAQVFYKLLAWLGGAGETDIDISRADFCLLDRMVTNAVNNCLERNTSLFGLIIWLGFKQDSVEYERRIRKSGRSKWNFNFQLRLAKDWLMGFSGLPLSLMSIIGVFVILISLLYAISMMVKAIMGSPPESWSLIMLAILLISGIHMLMLGVIGEYLWRNLNESRKRPLFFIEKRSDA